MTEMEKLAVAQMYIERLANGINPLTGQKIPDTDIINNVRIARCLFYVADVLRRVQVSSGGSSSKSRMKKCAFALGHEERKNFLYSETPIPISEITRRINALIDPEIMKKLSYRDIVEWLIEIKLLVESANSAGKMVRRPTHSGKTSGISIEQRDGTNGIYQVVLYNKRAQMFILDNLDAIIERNNAKNSV